MPDPGVRLEVGRQVALRSRLVASCRKRHVLANLACVAANHPFDAADVAKTPRARASN